MTASMTPFDPSSNALADGLTAVDVARVGAAITAERASTTLQCYASAWNCFARWCGARGVDPLPAAPLVVCAYLAEQAERGLAFGSINQACAAISYNHGSAGLDDPVAHELVRRVRRGLRRIVGVAPRRQARPLLIDEIRRIVSFIDRATVAGARDAALILLGFASALRRSELAALTLDDLAFKPSGVLVTVRRSKGDPDAEGQLVAVATGQHAATDPVTALQQWIALRPNRHGHVFTRVRSGDHPTLEPISGKTVASIVRVRAEAAGLSGQRVTGHSLRAGHATTAAIAGVPLDQIAAQTRHRNVSTLVQHYIRPIDALARTSSRSIGL